MSGNKSFKPLPHFESDAEAERFVAEADLSTYDLSGFKPAQFEFEKKAEQINLRIPRSMLDAVKAKAEARGIPFTRYIRMLIEQDLARTGS